MDPTPIDVEYNRLLLGDAAAGFCACLRGDLRMGFWCICTDVLAVHTCKEEKGNEGSCHSMHLEESTMNKRRMKGSKRLPA